jgi:hypothetical protein
MVAPLAHSAETTLDQTLVLTWNVPQECPSVADVRSDVRSLLSQNSADNWASASKNTVVDVTISLKGEGSYWLVLRANGQSRTLEGGSCAQLAQAAALLMALLLNPGLTQTDIADVPLVREEAETKPHPTTQHAAPQSVDRAEPTQSGQSPQTDPQRKTRGLLEVGGRVEMGRFPRVEPGLSVAVGLELPPFRILARGALSTPQHLDAPGNGQLRLLPFSASLEPAYRLVRHGWGVEGGLGVELGITHSLATNLEPKERYATSVSGLFQLRGTRTLAHWLRGWAGVTAAIPVLRPRWVTQEGELLHAYGTAVRGELGLQMLF